MPNLDPDALLSMLRDPNRETQEIAAAAGVPREDAARAARLALGLAKAKPQEFLSLPAPLAVALLRGAAAAGRADVLAAAAAHPQKDVSKEGKRALYVMKLRGMAVPEPARAATPAPIAAPEPPVPCFASTVDGHGERAVWIGRSVPGKGIEVGQAVLSDEKGLLELHVALLGRKEYRNFTKDVVERGRNMGVAEIDREQAKALVAAARALNGTAGQPPPAGADAWLSRLGPAAAPPDPSAGFAPLAEEEERAAVEASARLHALPLLRGWLADERALRGLAQKLDEIAVSSLYLDEQQRAEAAARALAEAVTALCDEAGRARWSSRLFAVADHLARAGDGEHARIAAATARALRGGTPAERIPFARQLVEKAFPAVAAPSSAAGPRAAPPAAPGPLIVPP